MILVNWINLIDVTELLYIFLTVLIPLTLLFVENLNDREQLSCFPLGCIKAIPEYPVLVEVSICFSSVFK